MKVKALTHFRHYGQRLPGEVWDETDAAAVQLAAAGLVEVVADAPPQDAPQNAARKNRKAAP